MIRKPVRIPKRYATTNHAALTIIVHQPFSSCFLNIEFKAFVIHDAEFNKLSDDSKSSSFANSIGITFDEEDSAFVNCPTLAANSNISKQ